jgi:hypothetical protein
MHGAEVHEHTIGKTKMRVIIEISRFFAASSGTCEAERKRRCGLTVEVGWCVSHNPPFVFCGIRLIGLPAPFR